MCIYIYTYHIYVYIYIYICIYIYPLLFHMGLSENRLPPMVSHLFPHESHLEDLEASASGWDFSFICGPVSFPAAQ